MQLQQENEQRVWLETIIQKHINKKSVARILDIEINRAVPEGENYASIISRAKLNVILRNGRKSKLSFIMKIPHEDKEKRKVIDEFPVFKVEIKVYKQALQKCESLMNEFGDYNDKLWCDLVGYKEYDLILFEDLKSQNYIVADRRKMLDLNHSKLVLHSLGRLHGLCYVLIQKGQLSKADVIPFYIEMDLESLKNGYQGSFEVLSKVMKKHWGPEWDEIADIIYNERNVVLEKLRKLLLPQENSFITMCHGDCWTCNMMFKYSPYDDTYPIAMKFLDFQTAHLNPYIFDLIHVLYVSVKPDIRVSSHDQLLAVYQKSLQSTLATYGFKDRAPTLEHVHAESERCQYFAFALSMISLPITTADIKDSFKMENLNSECNPTTAFNEKVFNTDLFKSAVQPLLIKWFNDGLF